MDKEKICSKCNVIKPLSSFGKRKDFKDGYNSKCKDCERERLRNRISKISYEDAIIQGLSKECTKCGISKTIEKFNRNKRGKLGSTSICKICEKERQKMTRSLISYEDALKLNLTKICKVCNQKKTVDQYYKDCKSKYGVINTCKQCDSIIKNYSQSVISYNHAVEYGLTKVCSKCQKEKSVEKFHKSKRGKYGVGSWCNDCRSIYKREHYLKNEERLIQEKKDYYYANKDILNAKKKIYRLNNKLKLYYIHRNYRQNNKEIGRKHCQIRRVKLKKLKASFTVEEWLNALEFFDYKCAYCRDEHETLEQDHVVPLSKGGNYTANNIIPACRRCNSSKNAKEMSRWFKQQLFYDSKNEEYIIKYLKMFD